MSVILLGFLIICGCKESADKIPPSKHRIISLAPHITEIIYALGAQDQLIAVTDFCRYPEAAMAKDKIGGLLNPNIEKMVSLRPTHLFGLPSHAKLKQKLDKFDLTVTMIPNETISDVLNTIITIGKMVGRNNTAKILELSIKNRLDSLRMSIPDKFYTAVLMIGREKGSLRNITVAGKDTYLDELWRLVGGNNCYADLPSRYGSINLESLLLRDPDLFIEFDMKKERGVSRVNITAEWEYIGNLKAVKNKNVFVIGGTHTMIPGPRVVWLAEDFNKIIKMLYENSYSSKRSF